MENPLIKIRPITVEDTADIIRWRNNPSVYSHFIQRAPLTEQDHLYWLENKVNTGLVKQFIIVEVATNTSIGSVYLRDIDTTHKKAEFGIFIGEDCARNKGYGGIATKLILQYAFEQLKLNKVFLRVFADNPIAISCYEKAGFEKEGLFKEDVIIDGVPYDMVFMGLLKANWMGE